MTNKERILLFAKVAEATYSDPKDSKKVFDFLGFKTIKFFNVKGAQAYLLENSEGRLLSFRGTQPSEISDVLADLNSVKDNCDEGGKVHRGFNNELKKKFPGIVETLSLSEAPLYITGHSLGAAMATLAASKLQDKFNVVMLITFGSPRVGTQKFKVNLKVPHFRCKNNNDQVTNVPPTLMLFRHHGTDVYLNYYGQVRNITGWQRVKDQLRSRVKAFKKKKRFIGVYDHSMSEYIRKLENAVNDETSILK
jgi:triacylglycerol lipase